MRENILVADGADYDKFYHYLTGGLSQNKQACVNSVFEKLSGGSGSVSAANLRLQYNVSSHPCVISGKMTEDEAFLDFISCFPDNNNDGTINYVQFADYYAAVSLCVPDDSEFAILMSQAWK